MLACAKSGLVSTLIMENAFKHNKGFLIKRVLSSFFLVFQAKQGLAIWGDFLHHYVIIWMARVHSSPQKAAVVGYKLRPMLWLVKHQLLSKCRWFLNEDAAIKHVFLVKPKKTANPSSIVRKRRVKLHAFLIYLIESIIEIRNSHDYKQLTDSISWE